MIIHKTSSWRWRVCVLAVLLACFGTLTVFEPVLHAHELDPAHVEDDCAPCNWSQTHVGADLQGPDTEVTEVVLENLIFSTDRFSSLPRYSISSRSPPALR